MASSSSSPELTLPRSTNTADPPDLRAKLNEVLEDLSSRFILNLPDEELASLERVCFQVEQAHWYYEDFIREEDSRLPTMTLKKFSNSLFHVCPLLKHWGDDHEQTFQNFLAYKTRVPVCGAIMLNETWDKCLLVKGWKATSAWSFPKGKINEQEPRHRCAVREVLEETGYDLDGQIDPQDVVELSIKDQSLSLYIVPNVPEDYSFQTRTRKEISKISWFRLTDLPTWKRNKVVPGKFYLITPFIGPLKAFIHDRKPRDLHRRILKPQNHIVDPEPHLSSEEDSHLDHHAQETGSQSSAADNGDPQTPSPHYSEPTVNLVNGSDLNLQQTVDPHFARLLSSLSLSASTIQPNESIAKANVTSMHQTVSVTSDLVSAPPKVTPEQPSTRSPSQAGTVKPNHSRSPSAALRSSPAPSAATQRTPSRAKHMRSPSSGKPGTNGVPPLPPQSPINRRRTADLSPYLSRGVAAPAIPKQMKYITMLENVIKESERMTPKLERQAQATLGVPSAQAITPAMLAGASPSTMPMHLRESPLIYASRPTAIGPPTQQSFSGSGSVSQMPPAPRQDDVFTVRPRTSNAFHAVPYPSPSGMPPSLGEGPLRFANGAPVPRSTTVQPMGAFPPPYAGVPVLLGAGLAPPFPPLASTGPLPPRMTAAGPQAGMRPVLPSIVPSRYPEPGPLSAPAISPAFNLGRTNPGQNMHLLNILNTGTPAPIMPLAAGPPAQPQVMGPR